MESNEISFKTKPKKKIKYNIDANNKKEIKPPLTSKGNNRKKLPSIRMNNNLKPIATNRIVRATSVAREKKKDTTPEICNLFLFYKTNHVYLYIPNSKNKNEIIINNEEDYTILYQISIPAIYKMRFFKYANMPECLTNAISLSHMKYKKKLEHSNIIWRLLHPNEMRTLIRSMSRNQKFNHFPTTYQLGRKDNMHRHYRHFKSMFNNDYDFAPMTFILPFDTEKFQSEIESVSTSKHKWIVKPVNLSRGRGIHLLQDDEEFEKISKASLKLNITQYLVSRYISNPHLINETKYDLRIYVLITSFNPLRIYLYDNGLVRFATEKYTKGNYDNVYVHLTNYSINKNNTNYKANNNDENGEDDNSSKWSLHEYKEHFDRTRKENDIDRFSDLWNKIKNIVIKTIITIKDESMREVPMNKSTCLFELYGFDIMIDSDFKAWLIEVNVNPSLHCTSPLDLNIKSDLISDIITIVGVVPYHHKNSEDVYDVGNGKVKEEEVQMKNYMKIRAKIMKEFNRANLKSKMEEYDDGVYKNMITYCEEERHRASMTTFELIFPNKATIEKYSKFILKEGIGDGDVVYWQYILSKQ